MMQDFFKKRWLLLSSKTVFVIILVVYLSFGTILLLLPTGTISQSTDGCVLSSDDFIWGAHCSNFSNSELTENVLNSILGIAQGAYLVVIYWFADIFSGEINALALTPIALFIILTYSLCLFYLGSLISSFFRKKK